MDTREDLECVWTMSVVRHEHPQRVEIEGHGERVTFDIDERHAAAAVAPGLDRLWTGPTAVLDEPGDVVAVGHRIVHGGATLDAPARLTRRRATGA